MTKHVHSADTKFGSLSWAEVMRDSIDAPSSRVGHSLIHFEGSLYLFGGKDEYFASNELWQYHIEANVWTKLVCSGPKPARLFNHRVALYDRKIFMFGGGASTNFSLWVFDFDIFEWEMYTQRSGVNPNNRHSHSIALYNNIAYMYGGYTTVGLESDELWQYDLDANTWIKVYIKSEDKPPPMFGHTAAFHENNMWIYGGSFNRNLLNTLWCLDTESWSWKEVSRAFSPPGLYYHISIVTGDVMIVYGGTTDSLEPYSGMWRFNFEMEEWTHMVSKELPPLTCHAATVSYVRIFPSGVKKNKSNEVSNGGNIKMYSNENEQMNHGSNNHDIHNHGKTDVIELRPLTVQSIDLRPVTSHSDVSKASSTESHVSCSDIVLPGMVDESMPLSCSPPVRIHRAVYENKVVNTTTLTNTQDDDLCLADPEQIFDIITPTYASCTSYRAAHHMGHDGVCVANPLYSSRENIANEQPSITHLKTNRITFLDPSIIRDSSLDNSEDSGSQGSRSSLKKKKYKRGYNTEFYIAGHGPDRLSKYTVLYHCKIG